MGIVIDKMRKPRCVFDAARSFSKDQARDQSLYRKADVEILITPLPTSSFSRSTLIQLAKGRILRPFSRGNASPQNGQQKSRPVKPCPGRYSPPGVRHSPPRSTEPF